VTGAPKISATHTITDLEQQARGVYCGAIGYLAPPGHEPSARFSVAIRTLVVDSDRGTAVYGTGGGVTYDSTPSGEHREALLKAEVLTRRRPAFELLETLRWEPDEGFLFLDGHLSRLAGSARYFGYRCDVDVVMEALAAAVSESMGPLVVRCLVDGRGRVAVEVAEAPPTGVPVRLALDTVPIDTASPFFFHKTTHRTAYERAVDRQPGADEVLLINEAGEIVETTRANVAVQIDGRWVTPPVQAGCLPGTYRSALLAEGRLVEQAVPIEALAEAASLAVFNSVRLWCPATLEPGAAGA
jgi:para-aminobenzoate synthetase/4-amino-4-deoxychorismate lyase